MGRPLKKSNFGATVNNNLKVQFNNGTTSTYGYIVKQYSSRKFKCADTSGTTAVCLLVDKLSSALQPGEMSITLKADNGAVEQAVRIHQNLATVIYTGTNYVTGGTHATGIYGQVKWSYSNATDDTYWQIEEAGTNTNMIGRIDLEGDDVVVDPNADYPVPGSGTYLSTATAFSGMSYTSVGTTATVTGGIATVSNSATGLLRSKYAGNFLASPTASTATWNTSFFTTGTVVKTIAENYISWGFQVDTPEQQNFSCEWKGYVQVPTTQDYNWYVQVDDTAAVWIGSEALDGNYTTENITLWGDNESMPDSAITNANSMTMDSTQWYPIRIWMSEFNGASKFQLFAIGADGSTYNATGLGLSYNTATGGYNP